jgi:hypothetical protein
MPSLADATGAMGAQPTKRTPETQRMYELLDDGEWHYIKDIVSEMARKVHPGRATRYVEKQRASSANGRPRVQELSVEHQVLSGKRGRANSALKAAVSRGALEVRDQNTDMPQVRLTSRNRLWNTERLARYLGTKQGTVQGWAKNPRIIDEVRAFMPDGVDPVIANNTLFGERQVYLFDPLSGPGWKRWFVIRESLGDDRTSDKHLKILAAVRDAMALTDSPEDEEKAITIAGQLRKELDKRELYIAIRQQGKINRRANPREAE